MSDILNASAAELIDGIKRGDFSSQQVTQAYVERIEAVDSQVNAFLRMDGDRAIEQARSIDERRARGEDVGLLAGVPVAVKDLICEKGQIASCGSKMLANFRPPYDATVVEKLRNAGAVFLGRTNMDEFAMGSSTENSAFATAHNPWDLERIPGGSSGGAAACVAAKMAPLSVGTDTGGSIRQPAGLCGVVGLKPTYGRVSRFGLVAFASSLDQIGPLARTAKDTALLLECLAGHDPQDSTSAPRDVPRFSQSIDQPLQGLKIGRVTEHFGEGLDPEIADAIGAALDVYRQAGATIVDLSLPHNQFAIATYYIIAGSEASSNLARYDGVHYGYRSDMQEVRESLARELKELKDAGKSTNDVDSLLVRMYRQSRSEGFGAEVQRRIMLGTYVLSKGYYDKYYVKAQKVRRLIREDFDTAFESVDVIAGPVTATPAFPLGAKSSDPLAMYLEDLYTVSANLAGIAAISVPCGFTNGGLPIGLQLQAPPFEEERLLRAAHMLQSQTDWHQREPELSAS